MLKLYGIPNCDTVKKAMSFLDGKNVKYEFINFKINPVSKDLLKEWMNQVHWEEILNKKSATYRGLSDEEKKGLTSATKAQKIILKNNSIIRRPIISENKNILTIGFDTDTYQKLFQNLKKSR